VSLTRSFILLLRRNTASGVRFYSPFKPCGVCPEVESWSQPTDEVRATAAPEKEERGVFIG
jgi:hypothetical protein